MAKIPRDHLRRMLDHQEKIQTAPTTPDPPPADPQLTIPLVGEVRRPAPSPSKRGRPRKRTQLQPRLGD